MKSTSDPIEAALDEALQLTFPASDPVALSLETRRRDEQVLREAPRPGTAAAGI